MRALALLLLLAACTAEPVPVGPPVETLADGRAGRIAFATRAPYDFPEMRGDAPEEVIAGRLLLPEGEGPVRGAALLSHGAGGTGSRQERMAEWLVERGVAAFVIDHFGPRGIGSTVRDQLRATEQTMVADLYAARDLLATHPRIPGGRIGVIGWSKGGTTAVLAAVERIAGYAAGEDGPRLAFAAAFYPFCGFALADEPLAAPLLMLLGGSDDWTPAAPCAELAGDWAARGEPAEVVVYEGAPHGFDSGAWFDIPVSRAISVRAGGPGCTLDLGADGRTVTLDGAHRLDGVAGRRAFLARCGERGVTFGGDSAARRDAYARIEAFLARALP
jgi:dienelactone hydrolase